MTAVFRAPMRSRRDDIPLAPTVARALSEGSCGFGGAVRPPPSDLDSAVAGAAEQHDERLARRIERFAAAPLDAFVWTRDEDGLFWVGRLRGPYRYDGCAAAVAVDLVHVRACEWRDRPVLHAEAPGAVLATFGRGGRNLQRIHDPAVSAQTLRIWSS